jgi:hypothetical protein
VIPRWTPRSRLTRGGLNGLRSKIAANTIRIDPRTELELVQIPSGQLLRRSRPIATWATLAGSGPSYTFTEAEPTSSGGGWVAGSTTGTAYEVNGVTGLSGTRQLVRPDRLGNWRFQSLRFGSSDTIPSSYVCRCYTGLTITATYYVYSYGPYTATLNFNATTSASSGCAQWDTGYFFCPGSTTLMPPPFYGNGAYVKILAFCCSTTLLMEPTITYVVANSDGSMGGSGPTSVYQEYQSGGSGSCTPMMYTSTFNGPITQCTITP